MAKIVVVQKMNFYTDQIKRLKNLGELKIYDDLPSSDDEWLERVNEGEIICTGKLGFKNKVNEIKNKFFSVPFVGINYIDPIKTKNNNTYVSYSPGCNKYAVSEWIIGMMFQLFRRLNYWTNLSEKNLLPQPEKSLYGKKVIILGKGNIGKRVGIIAEAIGMEIDYFIRGDNIYEKISDADIVIDCLSSNPSTYGLLDEKFFSSMKDDSFFISVTGSKICDINAMIDALKSGKLKGVAHDAGQIQLGDCDDVFYQKLLNHPKVLVTPHISSQTDVTKRMAYDMMIDNIEAWIKGKPQNLVE